ncbi:hypothetical protein [Micromonospora sp. NPDC051006]|uniref:hypothetical protein n=1 Tax=Micromonospora sp. NPDC051006 TaxID=3364283 RepID=UPI003797A77B
MRTPIVALLAAGLVLGGCSPSAPASVPPSQAPSPSTAAAIPQYVLTAQLCSQIDFDGLKPALPLSVVEEVSNNWRRPANFQFTGGVQCLRSYGVGKRFDVLVAVGLATYRSPEGARLAYDTRLVKETTAGSLPGVELMSQAHDDSQHVLYLRDGNLFVEVRVSPYGDDSTFAQVGIAQGAVAPAAESFAGRLVEQLRAGRNA